MTTPQRPKTTRAVKVVGLLQELVSTFPSADEKRAVDEMLDASIHFLEEIKKQLANVPALEDVEGIHAALERLGEYFARAESNPVLARAIGLERPKSRGRPNRRSQPNTERGTGILKDLDDLTLDQVRERIAVEDTYGLSDLRALAAALNLRVQQRASRESLANQLTVALANRRGYRELSRGSGPVP